MKRNETLEPVDDSYPPDLTVAEELEANVFMNLDKIAQSAARNFEGFRATAERIAASFELPDEVVNQMVYTSRDFFDSYIRSALHQAVTKEAEAKNLVLTSEPPIVQSCWNPERRTWTMTMETEGYPAPKPPLPEPKVPNWRGFNEPNWKKKGRTR